MARRNERKPNGGGRPGPIAEAGRQLRDIADELNAMAAERAPPLKVIHSVKIDADALYCMVAARRLRPLFIGVEIPDIVWAMLIHLLCARLEGNRLTAARLAANVGMAPTTAHRWIAKLRHHGLLLPGEGSGNRRGERVEIADEAVRRIESYLNTALWFTSWFY